MSLSKIPRNEINLSFSDKDSISNNSVSSPEKS